MDDDAWGLSAALPVGVEAASLNPDSDSSAATKLGLVIGLCAGGETDNICLQALCCGLNVNTYPCFEQTDVTPPRPVGRLSVFGDRAHFTPTNPVACVEVLTVPGRCSSCVQSVSRRWNYVHAYMRIPQRCCCCSTAYLATWCIPTIKPLDQKNLRQGCACWRCYLAASA